MSGIAPWLHQKLEGKFMHSDKTFAPHISYSVPSLNSRMKSFFLLKPTMPLADPPPTLQAPLKYR